MSSTADKAYAVEQRLNALVGTMPQVGGTTMSGSGIPINSATAATIAQPDSPVTPGTYAVMGGIFYNPNQAAGAAVFSWSTTMSTTSVAIEMLDIRGFSTSFGTQQTGVVLGYAALTNMGHSFTTSTFGATVGWTQISGALTCTATGTLALQAACTVAADTFTVQYGTWFALLRQF